MDFKEYLLSLQWNTFEEYPKQCSDVYVHCFTDDDTVHKFVKVREFNAVCFDFRKIINNFQNNNHRWRFTWLPAKITEENYDTSTFH